MKVKKSLFQDYQNIEGNLYQGVQKVCGNLSQSWQKVGGSLNQCFQQVGCDFITQTLEDDEEYDIEDNLTYIVKKEK